MATKEKKECYFSVNKDKQVDYKDIDTLRKFVSAGLKIRPRRKTGLSARFQRKVAQAIKRARVLGLMPYTTK